MFQKLQFCFVPMAPNTSRILFKKLYPSDVLHHFCWTKKRVYKRNALTSPYLFTQRDALRKKVEEQRALMQELAEIQKNIEANEKRLKHMRRRNQDGE